MKKGLDTVPYLTIQKECKEKYNQSHMSGGVNATKTI